MLEKTYFTDEERVELLTLTRTLLGEAAGVRAATDFADVRAALAAAVEAGAYGRDRFGLNSIVMRLRTAIALCRSLGADRNMILAILLADNSAPAGATVGARWGDDVARLIGGISKVASLYSRSASVESDNFRKLLLTFAEDIRVIIIMIVDRLTLMRAINHHPSERMVRDVAYEANYLYAPLAHRLGLYAIKSELEDMSLKYTNRETYTRIARELKETKQRRDAYIATFIEPIRQKLEAEGLRFEIKGRTKSIYSIWNKMKKQHNGVEDIFDLFAIRIVLDCEPEREKSECWLAYSIVTDMYRPNPARLKDWLSIPKSNGYESLHITVYGPQERWVEVQIRSRRMDAIAEKGLAAHWKYKGIKSESGLDAWMNNVRDILEAAETGPMELIKNFKMDVYSREVFVFTPKGDLYKLPQGATLLDFAFNIHTRLGMQCVGGRVNGKNHKLNYRLCSGDTVEIFTSSTQEPRADWLSMVVTSKARNKIRAVIKEAENRQAETGRELLQRRFKNRKIEFDEGTISRTAPKMGYKIITEFYSALGRGEIDVNDVFEAYTAIASEATGTAAQQPERVSASLYTMQADAAVDTADQLRDAGDVLVIGNDIKGLNYRLSKCCNPIYGDEVFGFVSAEGVVKIHRSDCPNAAHIRDKYPYRIIRTRWSGKVGTQFGATLRVVGKDDIGIVTNITSIINKQRDVTLRNISIDSDDGLFQGILVVGVNDTSSLNQLIRKISTVKGVKNVQRSK